MLVSLSLVRLEGAKLTNYYVYMKILLLVLGLQSIWGAHDDFRMYRKNQAVRHDVNLHYEKLSSVMESSPHYRWRHLRRNLNYDDYRSHKYLNKKYLPFHYYNAYYYGIKSQSKELHRLRSYPPYVRTLRIELPYCDKSCEKMNSSSPFIFSDLYSD